MNDQLTGSAVERVERALGDRLRKPAADGRDGTALCPAHDDSSPSFTYRQTEDGACVHCHAGCSQDAVIAALELRPADLFDRPLNSAAAQTAQSKDTVYRYTDEDGKLLSEVVRTLDRNGKKSFPQRAADGTWGVVGKNIRHVPYRLPELMAGVRTEQTIYVVEGEKDVETMRARRMVATCNRGGAGKWPEDFARFFEDAKVVIVADKDKEGRAHAQRVRDNLAGVVASVKIVEAKTGKDATDHFNAGHGLQDFVTTWEAPKPPAARTLTLVSAASVEMRATRWLWTFKDGTPIVPMGELTLCQGFEGTSKSTVMLDIASAITRGVLPGDLLGQPKGVIVMATEDSLSKTILPRLRAANADVSKVFTLEVADVTGSWGVMELKKDADELRRLVREHDIGLVILDPLIARLGNANANQDAEVRQQLEPIVDVAHDTDVTVIGLIHYNKSSGDRQNRTMGSRAFRAVARCTIDITQDPDDANVKLLSIGKANLSSDAVPSLRYRIESVQVGTDPRDGRAIRSSHVVWEGEDARSIDQLFEMAKAGVEEPSKLDEAAMWLEDMLNLNGRMRKVDLLRDATKAGIAESTLDRAARKLQVRRENIAEFGKPRLVHWSLPESVMGGVRSD